MRFEHLSCECCGSNEIIEEGDLLVCKYCGAKYKESEEDSQQPKLILVEERNTKAAQEKYKKAIKDCIEYESVCSRVEESYFNYKVWNEEYNASQNILSYIKKHPKALWPFIRNAGAWYMGCCVIAGLLELLRYRRYMPDILIKIIGLSVLVSPYWFYKHAKREFMESINNPEKAKEILCSREEAVKEAIKAIINKQEFENNRLSKCVIPKAYWLYGSKFSEYIDRGACDLDRALEHLRLECGASTDKAIENRRKEIEYAEEQIRLL